MERNVDKFYEKLEQFYKIGVLSEIYSTDKTIICNSLNQSYVVFNLDAIKQSNSDFLGVMMNSNGVKNMIEDENYIYTYYNSLNEMQRENVMFVLNDTVLTRLVQIKQKIEGSKPSSNIDLSTEEQLRQKNK